METRHAYLIIAHNNPQVLLTLLRMLDYEHNDIFLHVDKKSPLLRDLSFVPKSCGFFVLDNRIDVRWGNVSQVQTEYILMEEAVRHGPYQYYHLLSGVDLPIKSQKYILDFFNRHYGEEFVGFCDQSANRDKMIQNMHRYILFSRNMRHDRFYILAFLHKYLNRLSGMLYRRKSPITFYEGPNWFSITHKACLEVLARKKWVLKRYRHTFCCDETFIQSIFMDTPALMEATTIRNLNKDNRDRCLRLIDWERGNPYIYQLSDISLIEASDMLFARKFDWNTDADIVRLIANKWG